MGIFEYAGRTIRNARERYHQHRTIEILEGLPPHIRKDIGWPVPRSGRVSSGEY